MSEETGVDALGAKSPGRDRLTERKWNELEPTKPNQFVGEHSGRDDFDALNPPAKEVAEIPFVAGYQMCGFPSDGSGENWYVLCLHWNW